MSVEVLPVDDSRRAVTRFVRFAEEVYRGDRHWVQPLIRDQVKLIRSGPFTQIGTRQLFTACRSGRVVARLSVHVNHHHDNHYGPGRGFFGFFEALDDPEATAALFGAGRDWLAAHGCTEMVGPLSFSIYDEVGLLVDGFDSSPVVMCPYNPPYYARLLEGVGLVKEVDWYGYRVGRDYSFPPALERMRRQIRARAGVAMRRVADLDWEQSVATVRELFNEAWEGNWGHLPMTDAQWRHGQQELRLAIVKTLSWIVYEGGEPAGFYLTVKDLNPALQQARGRLFPWGLFRLLWHLRRVRGLRVLIMGFRAPYRRRGYPLALVMDMTDGAMAMGMEACDCSQIVETNTAMLGLVEGIGAKRYRTFRVYRQALGQP